MQKLDKIKTNDFKEKKTCDIKEGDDIDFKLLFPVGQFILIQ